jgi:hypothetical protein
MAQPKDFFSTRPGSLRLGVNGPYSALDREVRERALNTGAAGVGSVASVPCLNTHISIETTPQGDQQALEIPEFQYSKGRQKTAFILSESVQKLCRLNGIDRVAFLTLTFADHILDPREAQKRLNSLLTNVIKPRYGEYTGVLERQKSGRIHYHLLVTMPFDCRSCADFEAFSKHDYRTASKALRNEWRFWRVTSRKYGFGRTELMPIKSTEEAIGRYVGKYISKSITASNESNNADLDKGVRLVRYSKGARAGTSHFTFVSKNSEKYRTALRYLVDIINQQMGFGITEINELKFFFGPRWQYGFRYAIADMAGVIAALNNNLIDLSKIDFPQMFELKKHFIKYYLVPK